MSSKGPETAKARRHELFALSYVATLNATLSAQYAGYARSGARTEGSRLLANPNIKRRIQELMDERAAESKLDGKEVLKRLDRFSDADLAECYDDKGRFKSIHDIPEHIRKCIKSIKTFEEWEGYGQDRVQSGEIIEITFVDRVKATELLGKNLKLFNEEKTVKHEISLEALVTGAGQRDVTPQGVSLIEGEPEKETGEEDGPEGD